MSPRIPLSTWVESFLTARFGNLLIGYEDWREPSQSRSLKDYCKLYLPIRCPFAKEHSIPRQNLHETIAVIAEDEATRILCQHSSCSFYISKLNAEIRQAQWQSWRDKLIDSAPPILTKDQLTLQRSRRDQFLKDKSEAEPVLNNPVSLDELIAESPDPVSGMTPAEMMLAHLGLFLPEDLVWTADRPTSTRPQYFRKVREWMADLPLGASFMAGSTFRNPTGSRRTENLLKTRFVVFEHDELPKEKAIALLRHAESKGMRLAGVVDSGNRSVHGWAVADGETPRWLGFFRANGFCQKTMRATQPARLAGAKRQFPDGRGETLQTLLYLNRRAVPWLN